MKTTLRLLSALSILSISLSVSLANAGAEDPKGSRAATTPVTDATAVTPCPFLNALVRNGDIDSVDPTVDQLVAAAKKYGIDSDLMRFLAQARAESGHVRLSELLLTNRLPAHLGSLARGDGDRSEVETSRLEQLRTNEAYSTRGQISLKQLSAYQHYCWSLSQMGLKDRIISNAEVSLLWHLFGAYRTKNEAGEDVIPLQYVYDLLRWAKLPDGEFKANTIDPATRSSILWLSIQSLFCRNAH